jgi:para-aminobenzoate synthetase component 1
MLRWAGQRNIFCFLDNQQYGPGSGYECLLAAGALQSCTADHHHLDQFLGNGSWAFGHLGYDLGNQLQGIHSQKENRIAFPSFHFFYPEVLLLLRGNELEIRAAHPQSVFDEINQISLLPLSQSPAIEVRERISREDYLHAIEQLKGHILRGDCYEINFCQEFFAENARIDPPAIFERLMDVSPNPFSALYRYHDQYLVCASPERFLRKEGNRIISQPMKGTIRRDVADAENDQKLKRELEASAKDRAENVMVVDLVRNDLSRVCVPGSVKVDELFGVYAYPQVYQMISTVSGELEPQTSFSSILQATFPMGSMTGAPKLRVMELVNRYEASARGIFSGSLGYVTPNGDFDFNVVIRSIMYNAADRYLSYQVGSGITFYSDPQKEWEECLLKGEAIKKVLTGGSAL